MLNLDLSALTANNDLQVNRFIPSASNLHPYVKGYFYVFFQFPKIVKTRVKADNSSGKLSNILLALCEGYTPAGDRQIKYEDVVGLGDISSSYITGHTIDRNFSLMYREIWGSPILKVHRAWTSIIDPVYGGLVNYSGENIDYVPNSYKGKVFVIQTKPIALYSAENTTTDIEKSIIKADLYTGVFPTTDLSSMYDSNITDNSIVRPSIQYRFDGVKYDETMDNTLTAKAAAILSKNILTNKVKASTQYSTPSA